MRNTFRNFFRNLSLSTKTVDKKAISSRFPVDRDREISVFQTYICTFMLHRVVLLLVSIPRKFYATHTKMSVQE